MSALLGLLCWRGTSAIAKTCRLNLKASQLCVQLDKGFHLLHKDGNSSYKCKYVVEGLQLDAISVRGESILHHRRILKILMHLLPGVEDISVSMLSFFKQSGCRGTGCSSLHRLVEVTSFVGAQRVEGGHHKPPIEGAASQQPLRFFGVAGVGVLHKHLVVKKRGERGTECCWDFKKSPEQTIQYSQVSLNPAIWEH